MTPETLATGTQLTQVGISGLALGALYGVIALGFVIVYKATRVINLAHGGIALLGAYLTYNAHVTWGLPFWLSAVLAVLLCAVVSALAGRVLVNPLLGRDVHSTLMVTLGILIALEAVSASIWGTDQLNADDPWKLSTLRLAGLSLTVRDLWVLGLAAAVLLLFFLFFRYSLLGTAMRATAFHREAALAQGIAPSRIGAVAWAIAGALGGLAGIMLGTTVGGGLQPGIASSALVALSAIIVGGIDSAGGAVVGGIVIGVCQQYAAAYAPAWAGQDVASVLPYLVMLIILMVRPTGLFGTAEVRRI
ncbi:branched-chain amino acid ABC transporter permease [Streptomyces sp. NPDC088747]|uniref:branched-chain amino acid ABC transporter permease n=1 Tax=Streptomyces sp. NPDC088747 TaxID=3365886 RepID=UPI00382D90B0